MSIFNQEGDYKMKSFQDWVGSQADSIIDASHIGPHTHEPPVVEAPPKPIYDNLYEKAKDGTDEPYYDYDY